MAPLTKTGAIVGGLLERFLCESPKVTIEWKENDLLVLDNSRMLHARAAAEAEDTDRILERVLIGGDYAGLDC
jgi:alpha-ketoglutarate-dependent taurine dioxygenase